MGSTNSAVPLYKDVDNVGGTGSGAITLGNAQLPINTWTHIAMVCSPNNTVQAYVNGVAGTLFSNTSYSGIRATTRVHNMLGYNKQSVAAFVAGYDDVRVYNGTVLTAAQVATIYALT